MGKDSFLICLLIALRPLFLLCSPSNAYFKSVCGNENNSTTSNQFYTNLNRLLVEGPQIIGRGLRKTFRGDSPNEAFVLFLCTGYLGPSTDCKSCIANAASEIVKSCPYKKNAAIWSGECFIRHSDQNFFSMFEEAGHQSVRYIQEMLNGTLVNAMVDLIYEVVSHHSTMMNSVLPSSYGKLSIYVKCDLNLAPIDCSSCLNFAFYQMSNGSDNISSANIKLLGCNIQYSTYLFDVVPGDQEQPPPASNMTVPPKPPPPKSTRWIIIFSSVAPVCFLVALVICFIYVSRKMKSKKEGTRQEVQVYDTEREYISYELPNEYFHEERPVNSDKLPLMSLEVIYAATSNFSFENKLGQGGFGPVYKGILQDGKQIAVKRLFSTSGQGLLELRTEVALIARLQHRNLVRLLGCCLENEEKLLIYEYLPNKSLDFHLFGSSTGVCLDWEVRLNVINGISRGLLYLHEDSRFRIIHRDLKASNILLDHDMNPKISDFGMARVLCGNQTNDTTNRVVGTYGYMAPEYAMEGLFSVKSDVFSFGVLLLELMSGKRNNGFHLHQNGQSLLTYAWRLWGEGRGKELIDPIIKESLDVAQALKCIHIGLLCVQEEPANRPKMSIVVLMLQGDTYLPQPTHPAFSVGRHTTASKSNAPQSAKMVSSINGLTISNVLPR